MFTRQGLKIQLGVKIGEVTSGTSGVALATPMLGAARRRSRSTSSSSRSAACPTPTASTPRRWAWRWTSAAPSSSTPNAGPTSPTCGGRRRGARPMLAHKAEEEGVAVAERIAGQHGHVDSTPSHG